MHFRVAMRNSWNGNVVVGNISDVDKLPCNGRALPWIEHDSALSLLCCAMRYLRLGRGCPLFRGEITIVSRIMPAIHPLYDL